jgi:hypothetical protein
MAKLVLSRDGAIVFQCFVGEERISIGRDTANQIVVDDPAVSREHAAVLPVGNDHILEDLGSSNGTQVNGVRVARRILQHGDVIELGAFGLRYLGTRTAAEIDLDRTMLVEGLGDRRDEFRAQATQFSVPRTRAQRTSFPRGRALVTAGRRAGISLALDRVVAMFGRPGAGLAVLARRPQGYFLSHAEGRRPPRVNGEALGREARLLRHGDVVEVADERFEFALD